MAIKYTFGETILGAIDKEKDRAVSIADKQIGYKQRAAELTERVTARKEANELQKAMNALKQRQINEQIRFNEAQITGTYNNQPTLDQQRLDYAKEPVDMSILKGYLNQKDLEKLKKGGVDLSKINPKNVPLVQSILGADLHSRKLLQQREEELDLPKWVSPELDLPSGWGYDEGEVRDRAEEFMITAKTKKTAVGAIKRLRPDSPLVKKYVHELERLKAELSSGEFKGWIDEKMPAGQDAARIVVDIDDILEYIENIK